MSDAAPRASSIDVSRPPMAPAGLDALRRAAASKELSYARLLTEWLALWLRRRLSIEEYLGLQLFDNTFYGMADKTAFVGMDGARRILMRANYRFDLYGLIDNKIACDFLLAAHGLPIMPTIALYRHASGMAAPFLLRSPEELRIFLSDNGRYPLFGKPLGGTRSLGSVSFDRYAAARDALVTFGGGEITLDAFVRDIAAHYPSGYLFQRRLSPHAAVRALCGDRLATVRVLTAATGEGPQILRAAWKIPAGGNAADNFWRVGNLLAQLDIERGQIQRAVRASPNGFEEITHHPDTGAALIGADVPNWPRLLDLAREGARVMEDLPLLGWDIAPVESGVVESGAIIVEVNHIPDFKLHQIADRRGMLDPALSTFLRERKDHAAAWRRRRTAR
jgi:hypothetical protein